MVTHYVENTSYFDSKIPNPVNHISALKFSHWYSLASNLGIFIIKQSNLNRTYKELFIDLLDLIRILLSRSVSIDEIKAAELKAHDALASLELFCPFRVNSRVKHQFHHVFEVVTYAGPPIGFWM